MGDFFDNESLRGADRGKISDLPRSHAEAIAQEQARLNRVLPPITVDTSGYSVNTNYKAPDPSEDLLGTRSKIVATNTSPGSVTSKLGESVTAVSSGAISRVGDTITTTFSNSVTTTTESTTVLSSAGSPIATSSNIAAQYSVKNPDATPFTDSEGWQPNVLSGLQNPTYSIRFFMTDDRPYSLSSFPTYESLHDYVTKVKKNTTIAQSGVTGLNITSLEIHSIMAPNEVTRSTVATKFTMKLFEPGGVAFLDVLADTAVELGVQDYSKVYYFLEVKFQGYDEKGAFATNPCTAFNNKGSWLHHVVMNDIEVKVDEAGAHYTITLMIADSQIANSDNIIVQTQLAPTGATVGEMARDLANKLTESQTNLYGYKYHTYKVVMPSFVFDGKTYNPETFKITPIDTDLADKRNVRLEVVDGKVQGQFSSGARLNDVFEVMMANSEEVQQLAKGIMQQHELDGYGDKFRECLIFRVHFASEVREFDSITNSYLMDYSIIVLPYFTEAPILSKEQLATSKKPEVQRENARKLREAGFLVKRYDYLYSGMNTEVIDFDINYKANWIALLPKALGNTYSNESNSPQDLVKPADKIKNHDNEARKNQQLLSTRRDLEMQIQKLKNTPEESRNEKAIKENEDRLASMPSRESLIEQTSFHKTERERLINEISSTNKLNLPDRPQTRFAEEVHASSSETALSAVLPISTAQAPFDTRFWPNGAFPDQHHRDRALLGAVLDQMYDNTGSSLQSVEMVIRGDPYWLGAGGLQNIWMKTNNKSIAIMGPSDPNWQDYNKGDAMLLIYFRYPRGLDEKGSPIIKPQDFFTGVYFVKDVVHKFSDGQFTQTLNCSRSPLIEVYKAFGGANSSDVNKSSATETKPKGMLDSVKAEASAVASGVAAGKTAQELASSASGRLTAEVRDAGNKIQKVF